MVIIKPMPIKRGILSGVVPVPVPVPVPVLAAVMVMVMVVIQQYITGETKLAAVIVITIFIIIRATARQHKDIHRFPYHALFIIL